jgi:hypothetical protein
MSGPIRPRYGLPSTRHAAKSQVGISGPVLIASNGGPYA